MINPQSTLDLLFEGFKRKAFFNCSIDCVTADLNLGTARPRIGNRFITDRTARPEEFIIRCECNLDGVAIFIQYATQDANNRVILISDTAVDRCGFSMPDRVDRTAYCAVPVNDKDNFILDDLAAPTINQE